MKNLILGDCDQLIKFILFGDEEDSNQKKKFITKHTPRNILWNKNRAFVNDDDFKPFENELVIDFCSLWSSFIQIICLMLL